MTCTLVQGWAATRVCCWPSHRQKNPHGLPWRLGGLVRGGAARLRTAAAFLLVAGSPKKEQRRGSKAWLFRRQIPRSGLPFFFLLYCPRQSLDYLSLLEFSALQYIGRKHRHAVAANKRTVSRGNGGIFWGVSAQALTTIPIRRNSCLRQTRPFSLSRPLSSLVLPFCLFAFFFPSTGWWVAPRPCKKNLESSSTNQLCAVVGICKPCDFTKQHEHVEQDNSRNMNQR